MVEPFEGPNRTEPLHQLLSLGTRDLLQIPKTLVYVDNVDRAADVATELRQQIPRGVQGVSSEVVVRTYWADIDDNRKSETLRDFKSGRTRIVLCTDAFSLGLNVSDVELVIQWDIDEKLTIESLWQRIGRGSRGAGRMSTSVIFVRKSILESVPQDWKEGWKEQEIDSGRQIPENEIPRVSRRRPLERFGLPVTLETASLIDKHVGQLYLEARSLKEAYRIARDESKGTKTERLTMAEKIDPSVLWVVATLGCRHRVFRIIFQEPQATLMTDAHNG
jgi:superfamily II DNA/RNA helicase